MKKIIYFLLTTTMILFFSSCTMLYPKGERFQMRFIKAIERKDADYIKKCFRADSNVSDEDVNALLAAYGDSKSTRVTYHAGQYTKNNEYGKVEDIYEVTNEITIDSNTSYRLYYFWYASDFNDNIGISKLWFYTQEKYDLYLPYVAGLSCIDEYDKGLYIVDYNVFFSENHLDCISKGDTFIDSIKTRNDNEFRNLLAPELLNNDTNINIDDLYDYFSNHNK